MFGLNLAFVNTVERAHPCHATSCDVRLERGQVEVRARELDGNCSRGYHVDCYKKMMIENLDKLKERDL